MAKRPCFLVFSDDWGEHPSSCQHLFKHIVKEYPVVWVNTVGMRLPRLCKQDALKAIKKLKKMFLTASQGKPQKKLPPNLSVLQPFMLPYNKGVFREFNKRSVIETVRKELKRRGLQNPILVTTVPNACDYIGAFDEKKVVYYCVDDFANWPGHEKDLVLQMEEELISKTDIFVAVSEKLYLKLKKIQRPTFFLPHGVDLKSFQFCSETNHFDLIPRPRIGYVGLIDERIDWDLIDFLSESLSNVYFVFVGKIETNNIIEKKNIIFYPPVPYKEVPSILKSLDALILPYLVNDFTQTLSPLKLKEYLASGKPIVGVPLNEIKKWEPFLKVAQTPEEWLTYLKEALSEERNAILPDLYKRLSSEDWLSKAKEFLEICL